MGKLSRLALAAVIAGAVGVGLAPIASAQEPPPPPGFVEAVGLCRDAMLARVPLAELPRADEALAVASPEVRAAHPLGTAPSLWTMVGRSDADVTIVQEQPKRCSVFAVNIEPGPAFDAAATALAAADFTEGESTPRRSGGVQRNFVSTDQNARVELQTFPSDAEGVQPADILTMALFARRR